MCVACPCRRIPICPGSQILQHRCWCLMMQLERLSNVDLVISGGVEAPGRCRNFGGAPQGEGRRILPAKEEARGAAHQSLRRSLSSAVMALVCQLCLYSRGCSCCFCKQLCYISMPFSPGSTCTTYRVLNISKSDQCCSRLISYELWQVASLHRCEPKVLPEKEGEITT